MVLDRHRRYECNRVVSLLTHCVRCRHNFDIFYSFTITHCDRKGLSHEINDIPVGIVDKNLK